MTPRVPLDCQHSALAEGEEETLALWASDFALCRKGALPLQALAELPMRRTSALLNEVAQQRAAGVATREQLLERLYVLTPTVSPEERRILIDLQRDIYNERAPAPAALALAMRAQDGVSSALSAWMESRAAEDALLRAAETTAREDLGQARDALSRLAALEEVRQGLLLAKPLVYDAIERHIRHGERTEVPGKRVRHAERTLVSFLYRMALKTSPFGTFTELTLYERRASGEHRGAGAAEPHPRRLVRLSRALLQWMAEALANHIPECLDSLPHWAANTVEVKDDKVQAFVPAGLRPDADSDRDRFVRLTLSPPVRMILEAIAAGPLPRGQLVDRLAAGGMQADIARVAIDRLVAVGLLERGLGLADQDPDYAERLAEAVAALPGERAMGCTRVLRQLAAIERLLPEATASQRAEELARMKGLVVEFADTVGAPRPSAEDSNAYVFEDVARQRPLTSWNEALFTAERPGFALLQRLLPLFDEVALEQRGLYELFARHYGPAGSCEDLLTFYQVFASQRPADVSALMTGAGQPWAARIHMLRRRFCEHLDVLRRSAASDRECLELDQAWLRCLVTEFAADLPPWDSAAYALQFFGQGSASTGIVINNVMKGHGWAFSRFCPLFEDCGGAPPLRARVAEQIQARGGDERQADITAVFGMNTNLHPRLAPLEVIYPGCRSDGPSETKLTLRDIALRGDPQRRRIVLQSKRDGRPLRLFAHNFLFPAAGPNLYRFLCALTPLINYRGGLWARYLREVAPDHAELAWLPRLQLGRLVLDRRSWTLPVARLPRLELPARNGGAALLAARRWREQLGLPREGFVRVLPQRSASPAPNEWVDEMRSWAISARSVKQRKPYYIDFENLFLCEALLKQLQEAGTSVLMFQECLPATEEYALGGAATSAEEYVIELDLATSAGRRRAP